MEIHRATFKMGTKVLKRIYTEARYNEKFQKKTSGLC